MHRRSKPNVPAHTDRRVKKTPPEETWTRHPATPSTCPRARHDVAAPLRNLDASGPFPVDGCDQTPSASHGPATPLTAYISPFPPFPRLGGEQEKKGEREREIPCRLPRVASCSPDQVPETPVRFAASHGGGAQPAGGGEGGGGGARGGGGGGEAEAEAAGVRARGGGAGGAVPRGALRARQGPLRPAPPRRRRRRVRRQGRRRPRRRPLQGRAPRRPRLRRPQGGRHGAGAGPAPPVGAKDRIRPGLRRGPGHAGGGEGDHQRGAAVGPVRRSPRRVREGRACGQGRVREHPAGGQGPLRAVRAGGGAPRRVHLARAQRPAAVPARGADRRAHGRILVREVQRRDRLRGPARVHRGALPPGHPHGAHRQGVRGALAAGGCRASERRRRRDPVGAGHATCPALP